MQQGFHFREEAEGKGRLQRKQGKMISLKNLNHVDKIGNGISVRSTEYGVWSTQGLVAPFQSLAMEAQPNGRS